MPQLDKVVPQHVSCPALFPRGDYQFVHLINFSMPGGNHGSAMGVTVLKGNTIHCVLMTVEGLVLFSADCTDTLQVNRAVPPFDRPGFAQGLMADIRTIFLQPRGDTITGQADDTTRICRVAGRSGIVDTLLSPSGCSKKLFYSSDHHLQRVITAAECNRELGGVRIPDQLLLQVFTHGGYRLEMHLVSAEQLLSVK